MTRVPAEALHPAQRFRAPMTIERGVPLERLFDARAVELIAAAFAAVHPAFNRPRFARACALDGLKLMQRADRIADALAVELPPATALDALVAALGPPLTATAGNGLAPFFYLPWSAFIARHGGGNLPAALSACRELTRRFTAEFAIRPLLIARQDAVLTMLASWTGDPDQHVRRLVSEGTRPRLPWGIRLPALQRDPSPVLPLLDALVDDDALYVRRSVANHVGDIAKDQPAIAEQVCRRWLAQPTPMRRWVVRHALRLPARQGAAWAQALRTANDGAPLAGSRQTALSPLRRGR